MNVFSLWREGMLFVLQLKDRNTEEQYQVEFAMDDRVSESYLA
jgi:hypothetical protein